MTGNLWEWVQDSYDELAYIGIAAPDPVRETRAPIRVIRGGSYTSSPGISRCTDRRGINPTTTSFDLGLRLVWEAQPAQGASARPAHDAESLTPFLGPQPAAKPDR
jgi:formylglycine-generating enzyme required for sulfatase activity